MSGIGVSGNMQQLVLSILVGFLVSLVMGPLVIPVLTKLKFGQVVRDDGPRSHLKKTGTPTMGGVIIIAGTAAGSLVAWGQSFELVVPALLMMLGFGLIGFLDDYIKITKKRSLGLRAYQKILAQLVLSLLLAVYVYRSPLLGGELLIPRFGYADIGVMIIPFAVFIMLATPNSTNLTDGLDGLLGGVSVEITATLGFILCYLIGYRLDALPEHLGPRAADAMGALIAFCGALAGSCMGFLRHNAYPAKVIMGDTGSMAIGGALAAALLLSSTVLLLPVMGVMLVATTISVILQVGSYKLRKKRIFKMAPLHHHFELSGMAETQVVSLYMLLTAMACLLTLLWLG